MLCIVYSRGHVQYARVMSCIVYSGVMSSMFESCHVLSIPGVMFSMLESCHVLYLQGSCPVCLSHVMYCLFRGHVQYVRVMSCIVSSGVMFSMFESCYVLSIPGVMFSMLESCHVLFIQGSCPVCLSHVMYSLSIQGSCSVCLSHVMYCPCRGHVQYVRVISCIVSSGVMSSMLTCMRCCGTWSLPLALERSVLIGSHTG